MSGDTRCQSCGYGNLETFYEVRGIPVHSTLLIPDPGQAKAYPKGDLRLGFCSSCGFIQNVLFDSAMHDYSPQCEESQAFSPRFNQFAGELARRWIDRFDLRHKTVLEIGCGKGDFLLLLCEMGPNRGVGIDPSYVPERQSGEAAERIEFIQDFYSETYAHLKADFVCCRHTLEHIQQTREFVETVRRTVAERRDTIVAFELPDVERVLRERAFWDVYYEHCSYFSAGSLARLFRAAGFEVLAVERVFGEQYLVLEARLGEGSDRATREEEPVDSLAAEVRKFATDVPRRLEHWKRLLRENARSGKRTVVWGSSSKAVAFLTTLDAGEEIGLVTDINPHRQNMYIPGTGHKIVPPQELVEFRPDVVIAMNPIYREEIRADLRKMDLHPELLAL